MADANKPRSYPGDPLPRPASDPLAELARLIGQSDPFADFGRDARRSAQELTPRHWDAGPSAADRYPDDLAGAEPHAEPRSYAQRRYYDDNISFADTPSYSDTRPAASDPGALPKDHGDPDREPYATHGEHQAGPVSQSHPFDRPRQHDLAADDHRFGGGIREPQFSEAGASYDPGLPEPQSLPTDPPRWVQGHLPQQSDSYPAPEYYEDAPPPRRRGGLVVVMAVLGLAVVGTAAAFGYRAMFGPSSHSSIPPVIKADATPNKVVPAVVSGEPQSNKLSYDRVGDRGQGERVVPREEQPVEMRDPWKAATPRTIPGPTGTASAPSAATPSTTTSTEPKKVRTVTIRPDGSGGTTTITGNPKQLSGSSTTAGIANADASAGASRSVATRSAVPPAGNGPLAITPQNTPSESVGRVRTSALPSNSARAAAPAIATTGGFAVQVSSQRSEADAQASYRALQAKFPDQLSGRDLIIRRADLGDRGIYFRALVGPFATAEQAGEFCTDLRTAGGQCVVQRN